ncbi:PH domain-containing protein [Rathayibacter soli]|uniref:PH domain-containing protein n=1 Tax=Rathayibacter soli TaxID=3144168 RepID=UPI0027E420DE|nr:PH domain-containing protein [Glaciibacter superstes]
MTQRLDIAADFTRVSPKYVLVVLVESLVGGAIYSAIALVLWLIAGWSWVWVALIVIVVATLVLMIVAPRRARAIGYQLRNDDLLMRRGIMFQRFVSVPYGRMQLVDVTRGPIARMLGLAELRFVTAAASTKVEIPGLPEADAAALRDRLVELAESRRAGL